MDAEGPASSAVEVAILSAIFIFRYATVARQEMGQMNIANVNQRQKFKSVCCRRGCDEH